MQLYICSYIDLSNFLQKFATVSDSNMTAQLSTCHWATPLMNAPDCQARQPVSCAHHTPDNNQMSTNNTAKSMGAAFSSKCPPFITL